MSDTCRSCGAPIRFILMYPSGRQNPLDLEPSPIGNIRIEIGKPDTGHTVKKADLEAARARGQQLYLSHFVTCAQRRQWRRE